MKSNYEKLGKYIRIVDERNTADKKENLLGVSTQKVFIESIANTIGTDFTTYRLIKRGQFAYVPDTSRRGDKIGVALLDHVDEGMISQAYTVFEVTDENSLLPEYLMMWFRRPEFDRYARYMSYGSVREIFSWEDMCDLELPIPHIDKQREIVAEYNTILYRIDLNNGLIQKLEETAQAIYKQWFVDFEFPNKNGEPYKSAGGEMVESELGEIPAGWKVESLGNLIEYKKGCAFKSTDYQDTGVLIVRVSNFTNKSIDINDCVRIAENKAKLYSQYRLQTNDIIIATVGSWPDNPASIVGKVVITPQLANNALLNQNAVRLRAKKNIAQLFVYYRLKGTGYSDYVVSGAQGSANQASVTLDHLFGFKIIVPDGRDDLFQGLNKLNENVNAIITENHYLSQLSNLLLSKLATVAD
ncbi:MAG: restriction endonuclease subunit S [Anaerolineales bacterium]|nr:restriction endonuclease subunit S [Anaerolineales bacterium]